MIILDWNESGKIDPSDIALSLAMLRPENMDEEIDEEEEADEKLF